MASATPAQLGLFRGCFGGLTHAYGSYDVDTGRVYQVLAPVTDTVLQRHLAGQQPYGVYLLVGDRTRAVVADFDTGDVAPAVALVAAARGHGLPAYLERSKSKGHHVWVFVAADGVRAAPARRVMHRLLAEIGCARTEVFPKHDQLDAHVPFGNFLFCPLWAAAVARGRTVFVLPEDPLTPIADQWAFLAQLERANEAQINALDRELERPDEPASRAATIGASTVSTPIARPGAFYGLPPCAERMLREGVSDYQRVACFRLAVDLKRAGESQTTALQQLAVWASRNHPAEGKRVITPAEIAAQVAAAYRGPYRGFGCEEPALQPFCSVSCPLYAKRARPRVGTAAASEARHIVASRDSALVQPPRVAADQCSVATTRSRLMAARPPQRPVKEFRTGTLKVAIWENEVEQDGKRTMRYSARFGKRYFDEQKQEWRDTETLFANDLPRVRLLLDKAFEFIVLKDPDTNNGADTAETAAATSEA